MSAKGEKQLKVWAQRMGWTKQQWLYFQAKRLFFCSFGLILAGLGGFFGLFDWKISGGLVALMGLLWFEQSRQFRQRYRRFNFTQQVAFSKFMRMLIPYLLNQSVARGLYEIFGLIAQRVERGPLAQEIYRLMDEMNEHPHELGPFVAFARRCSESDEAINFMTTLFYYQQNTNDPQILQELGQVANDEVFHGVDEIIRLKVKRMQFLPMILVMSFCIPMLGIFGAMIFYMLRMNMMN